MDWSYLADPEKGLKSLVKLALHPLVLLVVAQLIVVILARLSALELLGVLAFFALLSPIAYAIRESQLGRPHQGHARRGAERTPVLPTNGQEEEE